MKSLSKILLLLLLTSNAIAQETDSLQMQIEEIENSLNYSTGVINLDEGNATLTVPQGFRFLDKEQTMYVLTDLWGNPPDSSVSGLLIPENSGVLDDNSWVFTISYDEMGYVKDDDAADISYDDLLKEQQKEISEANADRIAQGYPEIQLIGWASLPFYDHDKKVLHWARELKFGEDSVNTLNYNLRILGRKGIYMLNAIATVKELPAVKANIGKVLASVQFNEGSKYSDFNADVDEVAAWTVGGLVAGKILAKAGFFVLIAKFWKVIAIAVAAGGAGIIKIVKGRRKKETIPAEIDDNVS